MREHARFVRSDINLNEKYFGTVLANDLLPLVKRWAALYPSQFVEDNQVFAVRRIVDEGRYDMHPKPQKIRYTRNGADVFMPASVVFNEFASRHAEIPLYELTVPTRLLLDMGKPKYTLYRVSFGTSINDVHGMDGTFSAFGAGYIGITKRPPIARFSEHIRDMRSGNGYLFHASWRALKKLLPAVSPSFTICERAETLDEIYALEERYVEQYTLSPKGLNAIPGGKAGLRMMHLLRNGSPVPTPSQRDAVLRSIADGKNKMCAHFRSGHVRTLSSGKKTWVSPCWVNVGDAA